MISIIASSAPGLSPLARGTLTRCYPVPFFQRFIPAGAGNTIVFAPVSLSQSVYPRWRGEHESISDTTGNSDGLSPLARGTLQERIRQRRQGRFIPAGAGNTAPALNQSYFLPVYPRWRGEHRRGLTSRPSQTGLSPLARGTLSRNSRSLHDFRFIPAGAGNTATICGVGAVVAVYPRWRGEHELCAVSITIVIGLSPLARGTPGNWRAGTRIPRFIPAGAGNTLSIHNCF